MIKDMTNAETKAHLLKYVEEEHGVFSWPTDGCGYDQHIKFMEHRNKHLSGYYEANPLMTMREAYKQFVIDYANSLEEAASN